MIYNYIYVPGWLLMLSKCIHLKPYIYLYKLKKLFEILKLKKAIEGDMTPSSFSPREHTPGQSFNSLIA